MPVKAVSKRELQAWVSDTTGEQCSNLNKDCASGVLPITLLNTLHPNAVDARKMNRNASTEDQFLQNYKILEAAFRKLGIEQAAALVNNSAEQLAKGQPQSTLELMQNMYAMAGADGAERPRGLAPLDPNALGGGAAAAARGKRAGGGAAPKAKRAAKGAGDVPEPPAPTEAPAETEEEPPAPAGPSACEVLESQLAEAREEAEFAKEEAAFYFRKLELAQELCERSATEGRSAACAPAVLRLLFMSEEEIACLDDPGQLLAPAMEA
jgi:RP/EB family microtubule-associated protein